MDAVSVSYFLSQAKEARALADQMHDPEAKREMLEIAGRYERLAGFSMEAQPSEDLKPERPQNV
jgi:hypothetical protein